MPLDLSEIARSLLEAIAGRVARRYRLAIESSARRLLTRRVDVGRGRARALWAGGGRGGKGGGPARARGGGGGGGLGTSGATWHDLAGDQQTRRGAAPARPRAAAPRPRPDRPGVRAAAGRRGARPRRAHVGRAPQPRVPARLRRVAVRLPDDAAHRARDGAAASWRPQRHRGLFRGRLLVAGHLQHSLHRAGRCAAQHLSGPDSARDGGDAVLRGEAGDQTDQESRSAGPPSRT